MKNTFIQITKIAAIIAAILIMSACVYDGKVTDPTSGDVLNSEKILFNYNQWLEGEQASYDELTRSIDGLLAQRDSLEGRVADRSETVSAAVQAAADELVIRNQIGKALVTLGADYAVEAIPGAGPLLDAVLPYLFATGAGAVAGVAGPAAVRRVRKRSTA